MECGAAESASEQRERVRSTVCEAHWGQWALSPWSASYQDNKTSTDL